MLRAEWVKLRTVRSTLWLLIAAVITTVGIGTAATATVVCPPRGCTVDAAKLSLTGVAFGQAVVAVLAVLAIGDERGSGLIQLTFAAMPRRIRVLAAKAVLVGGLTAVAATVAVGGCLAAGRLLLPDRVRAATGDGLLSLSDEPVRRAAIGAIAYLVLVALLSLGVAALVRESAAAIGVVLGLFYVLPIVSQVFSDPGLLKWLDRISPTSAGSAVQATTGLADLPIGPWAGLGVLAAWAAVALIAGGTLLHRRDA